MAKKLEDILKGVKSSKVVPGSTGTDPGVDYDPKAGDERKFVAKHSTEKHADRVGNGDDVYKGKTKYVLDTDKEKRHGRTEKEAEKVYEAAGCNMTEAGNYCPVHKESSCMEATKKGKKLNEVVSRDSQYIEVTNRHTGAKRHVEVHPSKAYDALNKYTDKNNKARIVSKSAVKEEAEYVDEAKTRTPAYVGTVHKDDPDYDKKVAELKSKATGGAKLRGRAPKDEFKDLYKKKNNAPGSHRPSRDIKVQHASRVDVYSRKANYREEVEQVDEVLSKKASAGEWIKDFVDSDNPKFAGKSKEKRKQMALAAYYAKQRNESLVVPMLGEDDESAEMAKAQLKALANKALHLMMKIPDSMMIEPWVQSKIAVAKDYINSVHDYMVYGEHDDDKEEDESKSKSKKGKKVEKEQMDTPMLFPNMSVDVNTGRNV